MANMSSNQNTNITAILTGGPDRQPNVTGELDEVVRNPEGVPTFCNDRDPYAEPTSASDTLTGATSADVHTGYGHPGSGQTSSELHHDGEHHRKKHGLCTGQWGTTRPEDLKVHPDERLRDFEISRTEMNADRL